VVQGGRERSEDPPVLNEAAAFFVAVGDGEAAQQLFERSLALDPDNGDARTGLDSLAEVS
jgi:Tfp pilus assembly protein PilF